MEAATYAQMREELAPLDGYSRVPLHHSAHPRFDVLDRKLTVVIPDNPQSVTDDTPSEEIEGGRFIVTKDLWGAIAKDLGAGGRYFMSTPARLLIPQLNYWYGDAGADKSEVFMLTGEGQQGTRLGLDILSPRRHPVQATQVLDIVHESLSNGRPAVYPKHWVDGLRTVTLTCTQPNRSYEITGTDPDSGQRRVGDVLQGGVVITFSPIGAIPAEVGSYINRLLCTNGMTSSEQLDRWAAPGGDGAADVYEWMPEAISNAFDTLDARFRACQRMADTPINEDAIETVVEDLFSHFRMPATLQASVRRRLANVNVSNLWDVTNAMTWAATHDDAIRDPRHRVRLMRYAGDTAGHTERCSTCNHLIS